MSDEFVLDVDPDIPTGVEATPEQVAELVISGAVPAETVEQLPDRQRPTIDDLDVLAERPNIGRTEARRARLRALIMQARTRRTETDDGMD